MRLQGRIRVLVTGRRLGPRARDGAIVRERGSDRRSERRAAGIGAERRDRNHARPAAWRSRSWRMSRAIAAVAEDVVQRISRGVRHDRRNGEQRRDRADARHDWRSGVVGDGRSHRRRLASDGRDAPGRDVLLHARSAQGEPIPEALRNTIINQGSIAGTAGLPFVSNYCAAKAGIIGFTKSVALEVAKHGVVVNAIAPGFIETPMTASMSAEAREWVINNTPVGRLG